jgi:pimeloyl-ACP methyl ester carboxylesterase
MPTTEGSAGSIYWEEHGAGEPLLCVMGLSADAVAWALNTPALAERHRTIVFDNRDVGRSSRAAGDYEIADMAADALAVADAAGVDRFHLLGASMGGAIAQEVALAAPERVSTLTLAVTFASGGRWAEILADTWSERLRHISYEQHMAELLLLNLSEAFLENEGVFEYALNLQLQNPNPRQEPEAFARQIHASARHDTRDRLGSLELPVHVIGGEHDILVPVWKSRELGELIPGAQVTILPGAPHGLTSERAQEFNELVLGFIAEHPAPDPALET